MLNLGIFGGSGLAAVLWRWRAVFGHGCTARLPTGGLPDDNIFWEIACFCVADCQILWLLYSTLITELMTSTQWHTCKTIILQLFHTAWRSVALQHCQLRPHKRNPWNAAPSGNALLRAQTHLFHRESKKLAAMWRGCAHRRPWAVWAHSSIIKAFARPCENQMWKCWCLRLRLSNNLNYITNTCRFCIKFVFLYKSHTG